MICLVTSIFISITIDGLTSFLASTSYETHVNASIIVKVLSGISFHEMSENLSNLKDTLEFSWFLVC